jgi:hypothetical protein
MVQGHRRPIKVIEFLLAGHLEPAISLSELIDAGVFANSPPQSIFRLPHERFSAIRHRFNLGFEI